MSLREELCWSTPHYRYCAVCGWREGPTPQGYSIMEWWTEGTLGLWVCSDVCLSRLGGRDVMERGTAHHRA